jgi:predicted secreted Zn-dependent protease
MLSYQFPNPAQKYPNPVNKSTSNINDTVKNNSEATKESKSTFDPLSLKDKTFNKAAVEHGLAMLSYQFPNPAQKYPTPINQSILNLNDVVKNNSEIIKESKSTSDSNSLKDKTINSSTVENGLKMLSYQFPNPAQKYPSPTNQSILNLNDVVKNNSEAIKNSDSTFDSKSLKDLTYNKSAVENGLSMLSQQFPNSAQKYPNPIEKPTSRTLNDIIKNNSIYKDITKVKFGKEQK